MAGERTFTEGEAYALVEDAVKRELAAVAADLEASKEQVTTLSNEKDALELRATAAEEAKTKAENELAEFKAQIETQKAQEAKKGERLAKLAVVAPGLKVEGEREERIVAMEDGTFDEYVAGLREVAAAAPHAHVGEESADCGLCGGKSGADLHKGITPQKAAEGLPRESAAFKGGTPGAGSSATSVKSVFGARAALRTRS